MSISGGEPLLYPWLKDLFIAARYAGLTSGVVTNGLLIDRLGAIDTLSAADIVAVSVDGMSANHNALRGQPRAFQKVQSAMARLADAGIQFSVSCGIGPLNVGELDEIAAATHAAGASLLQLHPVEASGRAATSSEDLVLSDEAATPFYVLAHLLAAEYAGRMVVRSDVVHREVVRAHPHLVYGQPGEPLAWPAARPSELLGVLVMDPWGNLMPITYGFALGLQVGNIVRDESEKVWRSFVYERYPRLRRLGQTVYEGVCAGDGPDVFNPSALLARAASCGGSHMSREHVLTQATRLRLPSSRAPNDGAAAPG